MAETTTVKNGVKTVKDTRFKKGNPGGPGRPKKEFCIPDILRTKGKDINPVTGNTYYDDMCEMAWALAAKGDKAARDWVSDRTEGRALERGEQHVTKDEIVIE